MKFIDEIDLKGKKLLIRVDFNVPLDGGAITDDTRMRATVPTFEYALRQGAAIIVIAHLGAPKGKRVPELSLAPVARHLGELLGQPVPLLPDCVGPEVRERCAALAPGQVIMLENLRYHAEEKGKTEADRGDFGKQLADLADVFCFDAFGVAHRPNASVVDVPKHAKTCCGGFLLKREWDFLGRILADPDRPYAAISGGAKVSSKLALLKNLIGKVDHLIIGGAMANTFFLSQGHFVGKSLCEPDLVDAAREILAMAESSITTVHLPVDVVYATSIEDERAAGVCTVDAIPDNALALDVGPKTSELYAGVLAGCRTVVWNGPLGMFEKSAFAEGSLAVCRTLAGLADAVTIVGGGDTDAVVHQADMADRFSFISTGGGSFLEFMQGVELPGLKALKECDA